MVRTIQTEIGHLQSVLLHAVDHAFVDQDKIRGEWNELGFLEEPDYKKAVGEYRNFVSILEKNGITVNWTSNPTQLTLDSIYVRDSSLLTDQGGVICRMGKYTRKQEPAAIMTSYEQLGIPILGQIQFPGIIEGGDAVWLNPDLLAIGVGYRTNSEGIDQLKTICRGQFEIMEVDLPHYEGPDSVLHLMSLVSPVDKNKLLVSSSWMSVRFRNFLLDSGFLLIEVPGEEFETMGTNALALAPGKVLLLEGNSLTRSRLEIAGIEVQEYAGKEISLKGSGGPTCLTRPLSRILS